MVRETRLDHAHKIALRLARDNQAVYAEDLCVSGLARTRLAKSVHDAGWSQLLRLIEEKAVQYGRTFARIGRFEPTSQVCSACGVKDGPKPLHVRAWTCAACGDGPRPGRERGEKHIGGRAGRQSKRLVEPASDRTLRQPALKQEPTGARCEPRWRNPRRSRRGGRQAGCDPGHRAMIRRRAAAGNEFTGPGIRPPMGPWKETGQFPHRPGAAAAAIG